MSAEVNLGSIVKKNMNDLIATYALTLVEISSDEVLLQTSEYTIDVLADRDGVSLVYFDTSQKPAKGYNVFLFLANKRRDQLAFINNRPTPTSYGEFIEAEIKSLSMHLRNAAQDILSGSKEWTKSYTWANIQPKGKAAILI